MRDSRPDPNGERKAALCLVCVGAVREELWLLQAERLVTFQPDSLRSRCIRMWSRIENLLLPVPVARPHRNTASASEYRHEIYLLRPRAGVVPHGLYFPRAAFRRRE